MLNFTLMGALYASAIFLLQGVSAIICFAIALLVLVQLSHDAKGRAFGILAGAIGLYNLVVCLSDLLGVYHPSLNVLTATLAAIALGLCAICSMYFFMTYLDMWTPQRRWLLRLNSVVIALLPFAYMSGVLFSRVAYTPDDAYELEMLPVGLLITSSSVLVAMYTLGMLLWTFTRKKKWKRYPTRFHVGLALLVIAGISFGLPMAMRLSLGSVLFSFGLLVLIQPVLKERLFDPLSQLNRRLEHRAQQFALITRVGHQAHSALTLDTLLPEIAYEIQQSFGYTSVQVVVYKNEIECIGFGESDARYGVSNLIDTTKAAPTHHTERCLPSLDIPLDIDLPDATNRYTGQLRVQRRQLSRFTDEEQEALDILAQQIGLAIRNVQLLHAAQKANESKVNFISYVSHELRNAASNIIALSDNMAHHPEDHNDDALTESYRDDLKDILRMGSYLKTLLDDVVDLGQLESGNLKVEVQPTDPLPILRESMQSIVGHLKKGVELCHDFDIELPLVSADDTRLKQVLMNLLGNAVKFTEQGMITLSAHIEAGHVHFAVTDTGRGIARHAHPFLFEAYSQESREVFRKYGGSGLGLGISKQLVEQQGGSIWFESEEGVGTTFHFTLPLSSLHTA